MHEQSLSQLIRISHAVGARPDFVQGGGGNTSVKSADGKTMAVKASGTALGAMSKSAGWTELDLGRLLSIFDEAEMGGLDPDDREARVLEHQQSAVVGGPGGRASVEAALHALLGTVVIHTHPSVVNALTCGPGEKALADLARGGEPPPLWVPYTNPGYCLAVAVRSAADEYEKAHGTAPQVLVLGSHGIFIAADTAAECIALHEDWVSRCEEYFAAAAPALAAPRPADSGTVREMMAAIRGALDPPIFARLSEDPELTNAAADSRVRDVLSAGAMTPDQIVYTGARSIAAASAPDMAPALTASRGEPAPPRVVLVEDVGAVLVADDAAGLDVVETVASAAARTARLAAGRGGAHNLGNTAAEFILGWEVEHYRAKVLGSERGRLSGKVAVVTGAASGLGLGIALGLAEAGAAVAFCDIDDDGLHAAVEGACADGRALAAHMDVTDEQPVADGFDRVVRHWGGVDIVVCAAGIAPPHNLVDFPIGEWRRALDINLTGYFLAAREGARIMQAQGRGGSMLMVSSKTGLEASRANSAYNATKAGELGLMRGWALELGEDGIRVNAVAPGNVFEGSKIWNPEYIKVCADKRGITPDEVIPYYVNLTALKREIKRDDVAAAVVFLCSDEARCITGHTLVVDSGQVMVR